MPLNLSSNSTDPLLFHCSNVYTAFNAFKGLLILPFSTYILLLGTQQWWQRCSFKAESHCDVFAYHLAAMEMFLGPGLVCYFYAIYTDKKEIVLFGYIAFSFTFYGELFFHMLTCVEQYLAVVHPITYRGLRNARGVWIRNVSIGCVWLVCFMLISLQLVQQLFHGTFLYINNTLLSLVIVYTIVASLCSLSVLCALIGSGPGEGSGEKKQINQSKLRAFRTIMAVTGVLWFWLIGLIFSTILPQFVYLDAGTSCLVVVGARFCNLPSSLVSPLLFLHRVGKLSCSYTSA